MKRVLTSFGVFCNTIIGEEVRAKDLDDLFDNRMTGRQKDFWSSVKFKQDDQTIVITREFLDEQGMSIDDIIIDWELHGDTEEDIIVVDKKKTLGTKHL